ncbi:uncharacterized protein LOC135481729 [Liolophura sinensis]|uniref:uncharacterized protein LOC135481729 n=1 Tax=Liolophura sinensis TaxID=3198878 RepID=UPI003158610F
MRHLHVLLILLGLSRSRSKAQDACEEVKESLCITRDVFTSWDRARDHCIYLGGDLTVPGQNTGDMQNQLKASVWAGGRETRVWIRDNSSYYYGIWQGCVDDTEMFVTFRPSEDLSECLQSCSRFHFAYVKTSLCGCFNAEFKLRNAGCLDPYLWEASLKKVPLTNIHVFTMVSDKNRRQKCGQISSPDKGKRVRRSDRTCDEQSISLCQFANISSTQDGVHYGPSVLLTTNNSGTWDSGRQNCSTEGGSLVKLDWESPMMRTELNKEFGSISMWIGLRPEAWYFIDGSPVLSTWPDFKPGSDKSCLVWGATGLATVECDGHLSFHASCTLLRSEGQPVGDTYSGVSVGVGVAVGILAAVAIGLVVAWWIHKKRSSSDEPPEQRSYDQLVNGGVESVSSHEQNVAESSTRGKINGKLPHGTTCSSTIPPVYESIDDISTLKDNTITTTTKNAKPNLSDNPNAQSPPVSKDGQETACFVVIPEEQPAANSNKSTLLGSGLPNDYTKVVMPKATNTLGIDNEACTMDPSDTRDCREGAPASYFVLSHDEEAGIQYTPLNIQSDKNQNQVDIQKEMSTLNVDNEASSMDHPDSCDGQQETPHLYLVLSCDEVTTDNFDQSNPLSTQSDKNQDHLDLAKATSTLEANNKATSMGPPDSPDGQGEALYFVLSSDEQTDDKFDRSNPLNTQDQLDIPNATSALDVNNEASYFVLSSDEQTDDKFDRSNPLNTQDQLDIPRATSALDVNNEASYFVLSSDEQTDDNFDQSTRVSTQSDKNQDKLDISKAMSAMNVDN